MATKVKVMAYYANLLYAIRLVSMTYFNSRAAPTNNTDHSCIT